MRRGTWKAESGTGAGQGAWARPRATGVCPGLRLLRPAFSLAEIVVVLVVLSVAAGLIVPRMSRSLAKRELREAAGEFAAAARTARELAVANGQTVSLQIDLDRGGYAVAMRPVKGRSNDLAEVRVSWLKGAKWPESVRRTAVRTADGNTTSSGVQRVDFNADGTSSGAAILLAGESERNAWQIVISPRTGRVVVNDGQSPLPVEQMDLGD